MASHHWIRASVAVYLCSLAACATQPTTDRAPVVMTARKATDPLAGLTPAGVYGLHQACYAGYMGAAVLARQSGAHEKEAQITEAAAASLRRGLSAGKVLGKTEAEVRAEFDSRAGEAKGDRRAAGRNVLTCSFFYPAPGAR